jgi:gliding motility-associated-like protein
MQGQIVSTPPAVDGIIHICPGDSVLFETLPQYDIWCSYFWDFSEYGDPDTLVLGEFPDPISVVFTEAGISAEVTVAIACELSGLEDTVVVQTDYADPSLELINSGVNFYSYEENGVSYFALCNSPMAQVFQFASNYDQSVTQTFDWGDGSPIGTEQDLIGFEINHGYEPGEYTLTHTVETEFGCVFTAEYIVFYGYSPEVSLQASGTVLCIGQPFEIDLSSDGNLVNYSLSFSDGYEDSFSTASDTVIQYLFDETSCGYVTSYPTENAFELEVIATNACALGVPSVFNFNPIVVSEPTDAEIECLDCPVCEGAPFTLTDVSDHGETVSPVLGCGDGIQRYWSVPEEFDFEVVSGSLGSSNGYDGEDFVFGGWTDGAESITLAGNQAGTVDVWLYTANTCGYDSVLFTCEILPISEISVFPDSLTELGPVCSGSLLTDLGFVSSIEDDLISWSTNYSGGLSGVNPASGSGVTPVQLPDWVLVNQTTEPIILEVTATTQCALEDALIEIEVLPQIDISLVPFVSPDTLCEGEVLGIAVGSNIDGVEVHWEAISNPFISGATSGSGPFLSDLLDNLTDSLQTQIYIFSTPNEACPADSTEYSITVVPPFQMQDLGEADACPGETIEVPDYTLSIPDLVYYWNTLGGAIGSGQGNGIIGSFTASNSGNDELSGELVVYADWFGCPESAALAVTVQPEPQLSFVGFESPLCSGELFSVQINSSLPNVSIDWTATGGASVSGYSDGTGLSIDDVLTNTGTSIQDVTYTFTTPDSVCPTVPADLTVEVVPEFELDSLPDLVSCPGEQLSVSDYDLSISGLNYSWQTLGPDNGVPASGEGFIPPWISSNATGVDLTSNVTITAELQGCSSGSGFSVTVHPQPVIQIDADTDVVCSGSEFIAGVSTNVEGAIVEWSVSTGAVEGASSGSGTGLLDTLANNGTMNEEVVYSFFTPDWVCPSTPTEFSVTVLPNYSLDEFPDVVVCSGDVISIADYALPVQGIEYQWINSDESIGLDNSGQGVLSQWLAVNESDEAIEATVTVLAFIVPCDTLSQTFEITVHPAPQLEVVVGPNNGIDCQTGEAYIDVFTLLGPGSVDWSGPGIVSISDNSAVVDAVGTYELVLTDDATGCATTEEVEVNGAVPLNITEVDYANPNCFGGSDGWIELTLDNQSDVLYAWSPVVSNSNYASNLSSGGYAVTVINASNCEDSVYVELQDFAPLTVNLVDIGSTLCGSAYGFIEVVASGGQEGYSYYWGGFETDAYIGPIAEGVYQVTVEDAGGCAATASYEVECLDYIPVEVSQLITPNGDGLNDYWDITNLHVYPEHQVKVYNRWGTLVFEARPYLNDWLGTWEQGGNGSPLPSATYYYVVETNYGEGKLLRGAVEIQNEGR